MSGGGGGVAVLGQDGGGGEGGGRHRRGGYREEEGGGCEGRGGEEEREEVWMRSEEWGCEVEGVKCGGGGLKLQLCARSSSDKKAAHPHQPSARALRAVASAAAALVAAADGGGLPLCAADGANSIAARPRILRCCLPSRVRGAEAQRRRGGEAERRRGGEEGAAGETYGPSWRAEGERRGGGRLWSAPQPLRPLSPQSGLAAATVPLGGVEAATLAALRDPRSMGVGQPRAMGSLPPYNASQPSHRGQLTRPRPLALLRCLCSCPAPTAPRAACRGGCWVRLPPPSVQLAPVNHCQRVRFAASLTAADGRQSQRPSQ